MIQLEVTTVLILMIRRNRRYAREIESPKRKGETEEHFPRVTGSKVTADRAALRL